MRCLLALNGECDLALRGVNAEIVIGVDGGTRHLLRSGIKPDLVIGDFDSFKDELPGIERIEFPQDKDEIDALLALRECFKRGGNEALVACWRGERADMELALYMVMKSFRPLSVKLLTSKLVVVYVEGKAKLEAKRGEKWSVLPLGGDAVVTLKGFKYEIENRLMPSDFPYGVSNVATSEDVEIEVSKGGVLVFRWTSEPL